jgi:hypothetical protein
MRPTTKTSRLSNRLKLKRPTRHSSVLLLFLFALMGNGLLAALAWFSVGFVMRP